RLCTSSCLPATFDAGCTGVMPLADDGSVVVGGPPPAFDPARRGFPSAVPPACPGVSRIRLRCATARCCSDPRRFESDATRLPLRGCIEGSLKNAQVHRPVGPACEHSEPLPAAQLILIIDLNVWEPTS